MRRKLKGCLSILLAGILLLAQVSVATYAADTEAAAGAAGDSVYEEVPSGAAGEEKDAAAIAGGTVSADDVKGAVDEDDAESEGDVKDAVITKDAVSDGDEKDLVIAEGTVSEENADDEIPKDTDTEGDVNDADESEIELISEEEEVKMEAATAPAKEPDRVTPGMTQEEINAAIAAAGDEIKIEAGDYGDLDINVAGKTVRFLAGDEATKVRFIKLDNCILELENDLSVNSQETIVESEKSALELVNSTVNGNKNQLNVRCINSGSVKANAYAMAIMGNAGTLNNVALTVSGSNGDRGLLNINSVSFAAYDSNIQVCGNSGLNMWGSAGAPNICVGHDGVCATREILFDNCIVNASGAVHPYGDGFQINKTADPCTITFNSCTVNFDNNGGNGFMGNPTGGENTKKVVCINSNVSACSNGQGKKGASIGFANANIHLENTDGAKGAYEFNVSDNYKLGIAANGSTVPGNNSTITAIGYTINASRNGIEAGLTGNYGYGMYLGRSGSSFKFCVLVAEDNGMDGITIGGETAVVIEGCDVRAVRNGGNGLVTDVEISWIDSDIRSSCNGTVKGDEIDTTFAKAAAFTNTTGSIGNAVIDEDSTADEGSYVMAACDNYCQAVTAGEKVYLVDTEGNITETTESAFCHHALDWDNSEMVEDTSDDDYNLLRVVCITCGQKTVYIPLTRVYYDKNTDDEVLQMPDDEISIEYGSEISLEKALVREGYEFTGWYMDKEATEKAVDGMQILESVITFYAGWVKKDTADPGKDPELTPDPQQSPTQPPAGGQVTPSGTTQTTTQGTSQITPQTVQQTATSGTVTPIIEAGAALSNSQEQIEAGQVMTGENTVSEYEDIQVAEDSLLEDGIFDARSWSLVNLILMILIGVGAVTLIVEHFIRIGNRKKDSKRDDREEIRRKWLKRTIIMVVSILLLVFAVVAFLLVEDITAPMILVNRYTWQMAIMLLGQIGAAIFAREKRKEESNS